MYSMILMMTMGSTPAAVDCHPSTGCATPVVASYAPACAPAPKKCGLFGGGGGLFAGLGHKKSHCEAPCAPACAPAPCAPAPVVMMAAPCAPAPVCDPCAKPAKKCGLFGGGLFSGGLCKKKSSCEVYAPAPCGAPVYGVASSPCAGAMTTVPPTVIAPAPAPVAMPK
ncbi:hypothetical protein KIH39_23940 [Telmatocola sphagniphila]|uniref:Uncharacterized protein n=1 Tax=Telmatocola sphagniphila TaxID=1123043 RepID=A0A8E6B638_9BACT|nr:hypothetical protein [Telmatocola sphagniphila]QVL31851.1 hypothetical protein KIH39_23940 [Telmatocola sphagniphila]